MIDLTPDPVAFRLLGFPIYWYGIAYAVGLAAVYWMLAREARHRRLDTELIGTGLIVVAVAALIGGRLYHVIDQWALYKDHPLTAILPLTLRPDGTYAFAGFTGLGVPGGIITGTIAATIYVRWNRQDFWRWADVVAPALFVMQAIGRLGNFFNQELYGPPTTLPWGISIDCPYRVPAYPCGPEFPVETTHFHPLFLYESLSAVVGLVVLLWLARRPRTRLVTGDLLWIFFIWYGLTRFTLENLRTGNWTFFGIPTAQIVTLGFILFGLLAIWYRHGRGRPAQTAAEVQAEAVVRADAEATEKIDWDAEIDRDEGDEVADDAPEDLEDDWDQDDGDQPDDRLTDAAGRNASSGRASAGDDDSIETSPGP
jgi:phosphatidylglycerol:prolipoprotein diacylglycerol transferase